MNCWKRLTATVAIVLGSLVLGSITPASADIIDPLGDTFNSAGVSHDIVGVSTVVNSSIITVNVNFAGAISAPSAFSPNSVLGYIDLDTDQNPATPGSLSAAINSFPGVPGPPINMDADFYVDLFSESLNPGFVEIIDAFTGLPTGLAAITFTLTGFSIDIPLSLLGNDDGNLNYSVLIGNVGTPNDPPEFTDRAPNGADPGVSAVPEPTSLLAFAAVFAAAGACYPALRRKRR